ncbi:MAG TPA: DUF3857 domain-containing protein, partial [Caldithrix sp.]|nr:DUF3857 domain-containing protein [Caldithrix sp.]
MNRLIVFFLTSLFMFSCGSQLSMDTDDMLKLSGRDRLPTQADFPDDGAVVLYEDTESRLYLDSEWEVNVETSYHIAVLYLNDKAETGWATREIYLSDEMILSDFSARTIKANGEIIPLTKDDLHPTKLIDGADQISHEKSVKFVFPGVEPGAILEYSFTINDQGWFVGDIWFIQKDIPVLYTKYTMEIPTIFFKYKNNWTYSTNAIQLGEPQVLKNILTERSEKDQSRIFYWEITDIPAFEDEPNAPPYFDIAQYVRYDIKYKDWNELTEGYWKSLIPKFSDSDKPDIQQLAKDIIGDAEDEQTKIERIFAYTQKNFRYISTSIRRSGYIPNTCDQIIKNQYGDCKNMTVLNVNLLRAVGIEAFPALVATKSLGTIRKDITSISMFNHMIAYVKT